MLKKTILNTAVILSLVSVVSLQRVHAAEETLTTIKMNEALKAGNKTNIDNICLYLDGTNSLENVLKIFDDFYKYAGRPLDKTKTKKIWLGSCSREGILHGIDIINKSTNL